ncbi:MAG: alanine:cation symporter family protein, partial [Oscillospiraceae bacterium]|nr:alanine:cation symporter family protein [Oscillospiraceae bacterium]
MEKISQTLWGGFTIGLILLCGLYFTVRSGFVQLRLPRLLSEKSNGSGKNRLKAVTAALAASMGTGNITGCGAAIASGGAGAVLWMWVSAFLGMAVSF